MTIDVDRKRSRRLARHKIVLTTRNLTCEQHSKPQKALQILKVTNTALLRMNTGKYPTGKLMINSQHATTAPQSEREALRLLSQQLQACGHSQVLYHNPSITLSQFALRDKR